MSEKVCDGIDRPDSEVEPTRPDDYEAFARRYLADVASVMYHIVQGDGDASMDVNLARFDSHGNLSEDEFDTYRIEYKASENGGIGYTKLFPVKMICRRLPCKKLPRKTRTLIPVTRWGGFGKNSHRSKSLAVVMTDKLYARRF